ncbi:SNF7 family protein [Rhodotorula toruloides]|uniref:SNF7 family protein n=1 Tax=Rhodotorula toruloides TaxID=5286 RepID=A0A511KMT0_RHOTO|nr:SNF7 family protein [Rhodotorula toruloides]
MAAQPAQDPLRSYLAAVPEYSTPRVQFYYSSLPSRKHSNPTGYSGAISWWRKTLVDLVARGLLSDDKLLLHVDEELREKLRWDKAGRPSSLGVIVAELAQTADLVPTATYLSSPEPQNHSVVSLLARPFWWGLSKVWGSPSGVEYGEAADEKEWSRRKGEYVVPDLVDVKAISRFSLESMLTHVHTAQRAASTLLPELPDLHADALARLYTVNSFQEKLGSLCLPNVKLSERDCEVIKFAPPLSDPASNASLSINDADRSTLTLLATLATLSASLTSLESRIASEQAQFAKYASEKRMELAKAHLIGRKRAEKLLEERAGQRTKVQEVVWAIERAIGDEETLSALSLGTSTLRSILSSPTLQLDNIESTTSLLDETLISAQEVNEAVDSVSAPLAREIKDEVDAELRELVEAEKRKEREEEEAKEKKRVDEAAKKLEDATKAPVAAELTEDSVVHDERREKALA